jgi:hypothetical protein
MKRWVRKSFNPAGNRWGIAITESVYEKVHSRVKTVRLPDIKLKWQEVPLKAWEIV